MEDGLPILRLPRPPGEARRRRREYLPYAAHAPLSTAALRAVRPALAHAVYPTDALAAAAFRRRTGRPAILSFMGVPDLPGLRHERGMLDAMLRALEGCDTVVALSEHAAAAFRTWLGYAAPVIAPGVDTEVFRPRGPRADPPTIVCAADATVPRKQVGLLQRAVALLRAEWPELRLLLSRPRDPSRLAAAGVTVATAGTEWVDLDDREALARAYAAASVAVLPARAEAFGLVLAEALACGTPVVGFAEAGIPEVIGDDPAVGRLFAEATPEALAGALRDALTLSSAPGTAAACRARAERFSTGACTEAYRDLYARLLG